MTKHRKEYSQDELNEIFARYLLRSDVSIDDPRDLDVIYNVACGDYVLKERSEEK